MPKPKRRRKAVDPDRVLSGATKLDVRALLDLIHDINPTERGLLRADEERRYVLKSRLQSLLVREFDAELDFAIDPSQRVVAIRHRYGGGDGCHAILDELDEDVRAMLRRRFDERAAPAGREPPVATLAHDAPPRPSQPRDEASLAALLETANAHLEAYAYDEARGSLEAALTAGRGAPAAAVPLLELLVELLGMDAAALELEPRLSREARRDPRVRGLLALATARAGDSAAAKRWLRDVEDDARRVDVHAALADRALAAHDLAGAAAAQSAIRAIDPASPHLLAIEGAIAKHAQEERAALEAQLAASDDDPAQARRLAEQILARWPDSRAARRTLSRLDSQRRAEQLASLLGSADEAERRGALERALEHVLAARGTCDEPSQQGALDRRAESLRARLHQRAEAARVAAVTAELLGATDPASPLASYLAVDPHLRRAIRERVTSEQPSSKLATLLPWLEAIAPSPGRRAREAIAAVRALDEAIQALSSGDAAAAAERLEPHRAVLKKIPDAKRVAEQAGAELDRQRRARSEQALADAAAALERGDLEQASEALARVDRAALSSTTAADRLERAVESAKKAALVAARYQSAREHNDLVIARQAARDLTALDPDHARTWKSRADELRDALREAWHIETVTGDASDAPLGPWGMQSLIGEYTPAVALGAGGELVHVSTAGSWLTLWIYVGGGRLDRAVLMRPPEPLGEVLNMQVEGDRVWIFGSEARLLGLSLADGVPEVWEDYADFIDDGCRIEDGTVTLDGEGRYLWLQQDGQQSRTQVIVVDRRHRRERSRLQSVLTPHVVPGARREHGAVHVVAALAWSDVRPFDRRGQRARGVTTPSRLAILSMGLRPRQGGLFLLGYDKERAVEDEECPLELVAIDAEGRASEPFVIEGSDYEFVHCLASSHTADVAFVSWYQSGVGFQLAAFRPSDDGRRLEPLYRIDTRRDDRLVQDAGGRLTALAHLEGDVGLHPLTETPPELESTDPPPVFAFLEFTSPLLCREIEVDEGVRACVAQVKGCLELELPAVLASYQEDHAGDPAALANMVLALRWQHRHDHAEAMLAASIERHPEAIPLRALHVIGDARANRWERVAAAVDELDDLVGYAPVARHLCHVLGIAVFREGDVDHARLIWQRGLGHAGPCRLDDYATFAAALGGDPTLDPALPGVGAARLATAIAEADDHLAAGDFAAALRTIDRPRIRRYCEVQSLARAVEAHLHLEPRGPHDRLRKILALAYFAKRRDPELPGGRHLPVPGHTWDDERLAGLVERAQAWLQR